MLWEKDSNGDFVYTQDSKSTLYTRTAAVNILTYKIICPNNRCIIRWDGVAENIYRVSQQICFGEELFWDFIGNVCAMNCNFSAFCSCRFDIYENSSSPKPFVTPKTFLKAFFSWASNQKREFRQSCLWCGNSPKILACDATKIGILSHNLDISPIETPDSTQKCPHVNNTIETDKTHILFIKF